MQRKMDVPTKSEDRRILVTGTIAQGALRRIVNSLPSEWKVEMRVLPCTVAALMTTDYIAKKLRSDEGLTGETTLVIPGLCQGSLETIAAATGCSVVRGPKDLRDVPRFLKGEGEAEAPEVLEPSPMKILGEIVNASQLTLPGILERAEDYRCKGADIIDLGGDVAEPFPHLPEVIQALKSRGFQVSIDSHQTEDIVRANEAGVDFVLSLTSQNLELAKELACIPVLIPDSGEDLISLYRNMEKLEKWGKRYIVDPILPPLTMGLVYGLERYVQVRREFPKLPLLMGLGNVTELVDADSPGVNAVLLGIATELKVDYVLTTEVAYRARGVIQEVSIARDLMHRAQSLGQVPKHLEDRLLVVKEAQGHSFNRDELQEMQKEIKDRNFRIFVADQIYVFNTEVFLTGKTAQEIFPQLALSDVPHAFYLGRELDKAELALTLGKKYVQDAPLRWGYVDEAASSEGKFVHP